MQDCEAGACRFEIAVRRETRVEDEAVGLQVNSRAAIEKSPVRRPEPGGVPNDCPGLALLHRQIADFGLAGAPIPVPDEKGDGPEHLLAGKTDRAQIAAGEIGAQAACLDPARLGLLLVGT
ncbi:hypothetical protein T190_10390 [Sinorhizobium meliloti CCBAU 01290]|nr:hypothetical protein T190_10390 [Sinorhizobium meliloti CCBAU 01290]